VGCAALAWRSTIFKSLPRHHQVLEDRHHWWWACEWPREQAFALPARRQCQARPPATNAAPHFHAGALPRLLPQRRAHTCSPTRVLWGVKSAFRDSGQNSALVCERQNQVTQTGLFTWPHPPLLTHPGVTPEIGRKRPRAPLSAWWPHFPRSSTLSAGCVGERGPKKHRRRCLWSRCALPWPASHRPAGGLVA
jgi:hypothetical protein